MKHYDDALADLDLNPSGPVIASRGQTYGLMERYDEASPPRPRHRIRPSHRTRKD